MTFPIFIVPFLDFNREGQSNSIAYLFEIRKVDMNKIIERNKNGIEILVITGFCKESDDWVILFEFRLRMIIEIIDKEIIINFRMRFI